MDDQIGISFEVYINLANMIIGVYDCKLRDFNFDTFLFDIDCKEVSCGVECSQVLQTIMNKYYINC